MNETTCLCTILTTTSSETKDSFLFFKCKFVVLKRTVVIVVDKDAEVNSV